MYTPPSDSRDLSALNFRDLLQRAAADAGEDVFLIHGEERISFAEFNWRVDQAAAVWYALGVHKGDRVAFMLENRPEFLYAWLGLAKIGGILVSINTRWQAGETAYLLGLTEPRFALASARHRETLAAAAAQSRGVEEIFTLGPDERLRDFSRLMAETREEAPPVEIGADDVISLISTSGTTGRPKAVMQTHGNFVLTGEGYAQWLDLQRGERLYLCLPLFHINAQAYTVMGALAARGTIVLAERFSASRFWPDMCRCGVNVFNYIGSMLAVLIKRAPTPEERQHRVRVSYGAPALTGPLRREIEERFGLTLLAGFGMSENTFGLIESLHGERRPGSLGKPRQHPDPRIVNEARVVDDDGNEVPPNEIGELVFRNPVLMKGYYRDPEQTAQTIRDGWLYTGDLVRCDQDGFFYYVDRKKDIIRVRGENVSSAEVECVLAEHPEVQEAAVVGVPSELTEDEVAAFVVPLPGRQVDRDAVIEWCAGRLASFKVPRHLWIVESLPKTETQRAEKPALRKIARERLGVTTQAQS
jgi:crotonobetaine/carnitine-CoA ligase